ncbi:MAG: metallophosphoesterase [Candidatus Moranbacteria bacterium]|nr:metallophosphoesterase [Candidatus Moranbacteria bacterium]
MNVIFLGDIVARPGRESVRFLIDKLKKRYKADFVIANAENLAHGKGVTYKTLQEVREAGVDFFTSGNHIWKKEGKDILQDKAVPLIRPANYPKAVTLGSGFKLVDVLTKRLAVINLIGRTFFRNHYDCPFLKADQILKELEKHFVDGIIVDFHCEATSEVKALGYYLDGRVSAVIGTHSHVQTADAELLPNKTAYISDAGMCGIKYSVLGRDKEEVLEAFLKQDSVCANWYNDWELGTVQGVVVGLKNSKAAIFIERIYEDVLNK